MTVPDIEYDETIDSTIEISVVLPVYNCANELASVEPKLKSLGETGKRFVFIDDGSSDDTLSVALGVAAKLRNAVVLSMDKNEGVAAARNAAIDRIAEPWVMFLDWDDEWDPSITNRLVSEAQRHNADVAICSAVRVSKDGVEMERIDSLAPPGVYDADGIINTLLTGRVRGYLWTKVFARHVLGSNPFPPMTSLSDFAGLLSVLPRSQRTVLIDDVLIRHIEREGSITNSSPKLENMRRCHEIARGLSQSSGQDLRYYTHKHYALALANTALRRGTPEDFRRAFQEVRGAIRFRDLNAVWRIDRRAAVQSATLMTLGIRYERLYRAWTDIRGRQHRGARS